MNLKGEPAPAVPGSKLRPLSARAVGTQSRSLKRAALVVIWLTAFVHPADGTEPPSANPFPPEGNVTILRDIWGVPHIYARREVDGFFGVGYALAEDNLENILFRYIALTGRAAEFFGSQYIDSDWFIHAYGVFDRSQRAYRALEPNLQANYTAFMEGIRAYMRLFPERQPSWWTSQIELHPALITTYWYWLSTVFSVSYGLQECGISDAKGGTFDFPDLRFADGNVFTVASDLSFASNQMAVLNKKTAEESLYLIADPHVGFTAKRSEVRIHAGKLHSSGIVTAGLALTALGHNEHVAWAHTTGFPDVADCFTFDVSDATYRFGEEDRRFVEKTITIKVLDGPDHVVDQAFVEKNGLLLPVRIVRDGKAYVPASGDLLVAPDLDRTYDLINRATSVDDVIAALKHGHFPQNFMVADTSGELYYVQLGQTPIRAEGEVDWTSAVPGGTTATDWLGVHPLADLVQTRNPDAGYLQNNNVSPNRMTLPEDLPLSLEPNEYPSYIYRSVGQSSARGDRANLVMSGMTDVALRDVIALATDEKWMSAERWCLVLVRAIEADPKWHTRPSDVRALAARIVAFDGFASRESRGALDMIFWLAEIAKDRKQALLVIDAVISGAAMSEDASKYVIDSVTRAQHALQARFGQEPASYGDFHRLGRGKVSVPLGGGNLAVGDLWEEPTIRAYGFSKRLEDDNVLQATRGGIHTHVMRLQVGGGIDAFTAVPFGQSHYTKSAHYSDQSQLLSAKTLKPDWFQFQDLRSNIESWKTLPVVMVGTDAQSGAVSIQPPK